MVCREIPKLFRGPDVELDNNDRLTRLRLRCLVRAIVKGIAFVYIFYIVPFLCFGNCEISFPPCLCNKQEVFFLLCAKLVCGWPNKAKVQKWLNQIPKTTWICFCLCKWACVTRISMRFLGIYAAMSVQWHLDCIKEFNLWCWGRGGGFVNHIFE
ncbi:unnamed protein product [Menidia menidia]|uniref:(Atlantic silverside) hypothetical protein n=1 Tax=Menidia menidia TaxID=238744 RepID=A0A8S4AVG2_9TELE|nr:unnamed protein product [Menidia menidia]